MDKTLSDLDLMYDYEKDATVAATGYLAMAVQAHKPEVSKKFKQLSEASLLTQSAARELIQGLGGKVEY